MLLLAGFGLVCLAAYELYCVTRGESRRWPVLVVAAALVALVAWGTLAHPPAAPPDRLAVLRLGWVHWHLRFLIATAAVLVLGRGRRWAAPVVALLVTAELLLAHAPPPMPAALGFPRLPALSFLAQRLDGHRLVGLDGALPPNLAALYGLADLHVYDPMAPAACAQAQAPLDAVDTSMLADAAAPARQQLADLGVRFLVAPPGTPAPPGYRRAFADETATVFEGPARLPVEIRGAASTAAPAPPTPARAGASGTSPGRAGSPPGCMCCPPA